MKIEFKETVSDLATRIDIHNRFGGRDIDVWMLDLLQLRHGARILDVGCGSGKQCFSYYDTLAGECAITGGDVSAELLAQAQLEAGASGRKVTFDTLDFNLPFEYADNHYDLVSCCFAIYYAQDIPFTIREMHRVTQPGGRLFVTGPMPENKHLFYEIIKEATGQPIPPMPGSSRFSTEIYSAIRDTYSAVVLHRFENPLTFTEVQPFIDYTRASLSEDRKLWISLFQGPDAFEKVMAQITSVAERRVACDGKLVMTKVVGGILATK